METEKLHRKITSFYLDPRDLGKWVYQNDAVCAGDCISGCLLDNFIVSTRRGYAALYEHYLNDWSSDYYVEFQAGDAEDVFRKWRTFEEKENETWQSIV